jgi:hypothetical protein
VITSNILLIALFAVLFVTFRELSEHGKEGGFINWADWWNTPKSHRNKYDWNKKYLPFLPDNVGQFIFRKVLVWLTDAEHFFQFLSFLSAIFAVMLGGTWQDALAFYIAAQLTGALKSLTNLK